MKRGMVLFLIGGLTLVYHLFGFQKQKELLLQERHEVEVRLALVDVIVTRDGEFVKGLTGEDFELFEDGKRVPINSFELISFEERGLEVAQEREKNVSPVPKKKLVVLFDGINTWERELEQGKEKLIDELTSLVKLGHEAMILQLTNKAGLEVIQPFTIDEGLIREAVSKASASVWRPWQDLLDDKAIRFPVKDGYFRDDPWGQKVLFQAYLTRKKQRFEKTFAAILTTLNLVKSLPGRKTVLFISTGIPDISTNTPVSELHLLDSNPLQWIRDIKVFDPFNSLSEKSFRSGDKLMEEIIRFANSYNVSFYALDPGPFKRALFEEDVAVHEDLEHADEYENLGRKEKLWMMQNLTWLSEGTGGKVLLGGKKYKAFRQVVKRDLSHYYQLSFYPRRGEADDKYHKIKVKVKRRGVDIRFREGYTDYSPQETHKMLLISAIYNPSQFQQLPLEAEVIPFHKDKGKYAAWLNIGLPAEIFREQFIEYGARTFVLQTWIKEMGSGKEAYEGQVRIPVNITASFMEYVREGGPVGLRFRGPELDLRKKEYRVVFALLDSRTNEVGTWESLLSLKELKDKSEGAFVSCVLGTMASGGGKGRESFSLSREDGSLMYGGLKYFPRVGARFLPGEEAYVFMQVYLPGGRKETRPAFLIVETEALSVKLPAGLAAESWDKKAGVWSGVFKLDLGTLGAGEHRLKITIPASEEGDVIEKEMKLRIFSENPV